MDLNTNSTRRGRLAAAALVPVLIFGGALALPATASAAEGDEQIVTVQEVVEDNSGIETGQDAPEADLIEEKPAEIPAEQPADETPAEQPTDEVPVEDSGEQGNDQGGEEIPGETPGETPVGIPDEEEEVATTPNSVRNLNVTTSSNGGLFATWSAPEDNGVAIENYSVYLLQTHQPNGAPGDLTLNFSTPNTGFSLPELPAGTWTAFVTAHNITNQTASEPVSFQGVVVLDAAAPIFTAGLPAVTSVWANQDLNFYVVLSDETPGELSWEFRLAGGDWLPIVGQTGNNLNLASGLPAEYDGGQIRAVATNGTAVSYSTTTIEIKPVVAPGTVQDLRVEDNVIYWAAPVSNGGAPVTVYRIVISGPNGVEHFDYAVPETNSFARFARAAAVGEFSFAYDFIPGAIYSVEILAANESGFGVGAPVDYEAVEDTANGGTDNGNGGTDNGSGTDNGAGTPGTGGATGGNVSGGTGAGTVADVAAAQVSTTGSAVDSASGDLARTGAEVAGNVLLAGALALLAGFGLFVRGRRRATA